VAEYVKYGLNKLTQRYAKQKNTEQHMQEEVAAESHNEGTTE
jgi:Arc/MetJ-type ribon-helix-helix transcriptional regulator